MKKQYILGTILLIGFIIGYTIGDTLSEVPEVDKEPTAYELLERVKN